MAYSKISFLELKQKFGIENQIKKLFAPVQPIAPSPHLLEMIAASQELPVRTEKYKSEIIVFPFLMELRANNQKFFTIYSGENLEADKKAGLNGECDFILAKNVGSYTLNTPIIQIVEAKRDDFEAGVPQCAAQMVGAQLYNAQQDDAQTNISIYGCVTNAQEWRFLKLENNTVTIDSDFYFISQPEIILGVFQEIINYYKKILT
jgi:hypothetical protein